MDREAEIQQAIVEALGKTEHDKTPLDLVGDIPALEAALEAIIDGRVNAARGQGLSWEAIAQRLGISRQAAHKRFGKGKRRKGRGNKSGLRLELRVDTSEGSNDRKQSG